MIFHPVYFIMIAPAVLLAMWAQWKVKSTFAAAQREPARMSGARAAREILDGAGLHNVAIEQVPGHLSDHYDPHHKVLRLSQSVYNSNTLAAVGIAAHEAGHAVQDARGYLPLVVRNAAVPAASFGSGASIIMLILGAILQIGPLIYVGIAAFGAVVFFQLVNLPVEFNASSRAKELLVAQGIVNQYDMGPVNKVLNAAAMTYVAATLQAVLTLLSYIIIFLGGSRD